MSYFQRLNQGRIDRKTYAVGLFLTFGAIPLYCFGGFFAGVYLYTILSLLFGTLGVSFPLMNYLLGFIVISFLFIPILYYFFLYNISIVTRRLHDYTIVRKTPFDVIDFLNIIDNITLGLSGKPIELLVTKGDEGENMYGLPSPATSLWKILRQIYNPK